MSGGSTAACLLMGDFIASLGICTETLCQGAAMLLEQVQLICCALKGAGQGLEALCSAAVAKGHGGVGSEPHERVGQTCIAVGMST